MDILSPEQLNFLSSVVSRDRINTGESALNLHCHDFSFHNCRKPAVVVWPETTDEVSKIIAWANENIIPVTPWGAGSSLEGNPIPIKGGIVLDMNLMNRLINVWPEDFQAEVEPGLSYKDLNHKLRHQGLFFPPDPGAAASLGGMIANNSSGVRTVKYGSTRDYIKGLEIVLPNGQIINTGTRAHKSSSGYNLTGLIVGSEGTLGVVTRATIKLAGLPEHFAAIVVSFDNINQATSAVQHIMQSGLSPAALELLTQPLISLIHQYNDLDLPDLPNLFIEFHSFSESSLTEAVETAKEICLDFNARSFDSGLGRENRDKLWQARHALGETIQNAHPGLETMATDTAVPISSYSEFISFCQSVVDEYSLIGYIFGHAGDGNLHLVWPGDPKDKVVWPLIEAANEKIVRKAIEFNGTATGEHGVGIGKRKYMAMEHGNSLELMKTIKRAFDPNGIMNPGKVLPD